MKFRPIKNGETISCNFNIAKWGNGYEVQIDETGDIFRKRKRVKDPWEYAYAAKNIFHAQAAEDIKKGDLVFYLNGKIRKAGNYKNLFNS